MNLFKKTFQLTCPVSTISSTKKASIPSWINALRLFNIKLNKPFLLVYEYDQQNELKVNITTKMKLQ